MPAKTSLEYIANHVFFPPKLPQKDDYSIIHARTLCISILQSAVAYGLCVPIADRGRWDKIGRMLKYLCATQESEALSKEGIKESIMAMQVGDIITLYIRAQNAGLIIRRITNESIFESFEVSLPNTDVMKAEGKIRRSFPGPAIAVPCDIVKEPAFVEELASFLAQMNVDVLDAAPKTKKAKSAVTEIRDTTHPCYITQLLTGILRGMGHAAEITRIAKRIADDVLWKDTFAPWRRSPLWLVIRVAIQTSLYQGDGHIDYKAFMVFAMARMLQEVLDADFSSDLLFCMRSKICRRLYKLNSTTPKFVQTNVQDVVAATDKILQKRWSSAQRHQAISAPWAPEGLDIAGDTSLSLSRSSKYLRQAMRNDVSHSISGAFKPKCTARFRLPFDFCDYGESGLANAAKFDPFVALADFELAVQEALDHWISRNLHVDTSCHTIASCFTQYYNAAKKVYATNPESRSIMLLTLVELWVAVDRLAIAQCPLLHAYSPEFPSNLMEPLLLRKSKALGRIEYIETYIQGRHDGAKAGPVFTDDLHDNTFAIRYFNSSPKHQALLSKIEGLAASARTEKIEELNRMNAEHRDLQREYNSMEHHWSTDSWGDYAHQHYQCPRCSLERQAQSMRITVHEWPLPRNQLQAKAVVFELQCPSFFDIWRSITYQFLFDICTTTDAPSDNPPVHLHTYRGLQGFGTQNPEPHITYASPTKSFMNSHYSTTAIPADESSVCVNNGLTFRLFDTRKHKWAANPFMECSIIQYCTLQLPAGPYALLQYAVEETSHTSNHMLANQEDCPKDLSLLEYAAFAGLRSGPRLQWLNIAREIRTRALTFRREEVHTLLTQAAWEIGPLQGEGREWHTELHVAEFAAVLLRELSSLLTSVEANWAEVMSVRTIITLISRLLVSASDPHITDEAYALLRRSRRVTFTWMHQLTEKLRETEEDKVREVQRRVCEVAATCRGTYDVDPQHLHALLHSLDDYAVLVECTIIVHDNTPSSVTGLPSDFRNLLDRDRRLSHTIEPVFFQHSQEHSGGLDRALAAIWPGYRKGSSWLPLASPNNRWLVATTAKAGQESQSIQFSFLEGQLLVNGNPLGRLPERFLRHPTYTRIFGQMIIDVIPADMPGMDFAARVPIFNHQVFFAMRDNDTRLVVRTRRESQILELVPHEIFTFDLPSPLVHNYVHWMNPSDGKVELRPLGSMWESSPKNWELQFSNNGIYTIRKGSVLLVDIHSSTFKTIHSSLRSLEYPEFLIVTHCGENQALLAELPRFRLSFFLNESNLLESHNLPGMVVDSDQCTGTMIGLSNQLVLRPGHSIVGNLPRSRRVIIPSGKVTYDTQSYHTAISVDTTSEVSVKFYEYKIDTDLGRLIGDGSLASKLYKAHLHAISSHCLPDPLTGCTGTQEALRELRHAGCFSFQALTTAERQILRSISALAPIHKYYPPHLKAMQSVAWSSLAALAQHQGFYWAIESITAYAERMQVFEVTACKDNLRSGQKLPDTHLQLRAARRMALFDPDETIESPSLSPCKPDMSYSCRDFAMTMQHGMKNETVAFSVASMVHRWPTNLNTAPQLLKTLIGWGSVGQGRVALSYSREWLQRNLGQTWFSMYNLFRSSRRDKNRFQLAFCLSAMAYCSVENSSLVPTLLAFATNPRFSTLSPPPWSTYNLTLGFSPQRSQLLQLIRSGSSFASSNEAQLAARHRETQHALTQRRQSAYLARLETQAATVADYCISQWPCRQPNLPPRPPNNWVFDDLKVSTKIKASFESWFHNRELQNHIVEVQHVLDGMKKPSPIATPSYYPSPSSQQLGSSRGTLVTFDQIFQRKPPTNVGYAPKSLLTGEPEFQSPSDSSDLRDLLSEFQNSENAFRSLYGNSLDESRKKFMDDRIRIFPALISHSLAALIDYGDQCRKHLGELFRSIHASLSPLDLRERMIHIGGQWPQITFGSLLRKLAAMHRKKLSGQWEEVLALLAQRMLLYQQSQRLIHLALLQNRDEFFRELENATCNDQKTIKSVDWLLIQIDGDFLARPIQVDVAREMISPSSKQNTVLQLNMGEGKSSVIVPMVAAIVADGRTLTRVVVLKSLSSQMFQLLVGRMSGLANRRIFYMPFSRSVKLGTSQVTIIGDLYKQCVEVGGILVVQPEHILSFKLMGIERLLCHSTSVDSSNIARTLLASQRWLQTTSRDILDESDEILHVRYQLIYTVGLQQSLEGHPDRWTTTQQILLLVRKHAPRVQNKFPNGLELQCVVNGSFPVTRILQQEAGNLLVELVAMDVMDGFLPNCPFSIFPPELRRAALRFLTEKDIREGDDVMLMSYCEGSGSWKVLLLLRGLLAHGILSYALKERRWRVDYGLDLSRSLLAVPYRAKDVPAPRAEFGHPDVAIVLTFLAYYYGGLSVDEMDLCFQLLYKLDNPTMEYESWVRNDPCIPTRLQQLSGVNTRDPEQRTAYIYPLFRLNHLVIDFYLTQVVFPKSAKEFPQKLPTSGWDLGEEKKLLVTGFSGTNDNQHLLPTSITQRDTLGQLSTNAKVLTYLMRSENDAYLCVQGSNGRQLSTAEFLTCLVHEDPEIRVLLDVGAQMLDLRNVELAEHWLYLKPGVSAVIFFGDNDEISVLTRDGTVESFLSSPFSQQLDKCLVYLDDVHTRGTDLKLPRNTRAAVTLGPKVTKDRLLQGCMRMRKLGHGQSVMFFAPFEVDQKIRKIARKIANVKVEVVDILRWSMVETCTDIQRHAPLWVEQGLDHYRRKEAWLQLSPSDNSSVERLKSAWLRPEAHTLEDMYGRVSLFGGDSLHSAAFSIPAIQQRCRTLGAIKLSNTQMAEEQEREVDHEIESERQIERPPKAQAAKHHVHQHLRQLVRTGVIPFKSSQFVSVFSSLNSSPAAPKGYHIWSLELLATKDFSTTVQGSYQASGEYLRPVHWILSSEVQGTTILVLLSPYEVNYLLPKIRESKHVHIHIYSPRVTQAMESFEDLRFYCIPPLPSSRTSPTPRIIDQLNLWAGQLYLVDQQAYERLSQFLGLSTKKIQSQGEIITQHDGFIKPEHRRDTLMSSCLFMESPVPFLKNLTALRRKGLGYSLTHMGKLLRAIPLIEEDFALHEEC